MIHRYLELPPVSKSLEILLDHLGCLYKFHGKIFYYMIIICLNICCFKLHVIIYSEFVDMFFERFNLINTVLSLNKKIGL